MRKLYSLIRATMSSDMSLFKIKTKKNSKSKIYLPLFIAGYLMFMIWGSANAIFEKIEPMGLQIIILSLAAFSISIMTFMEGIYKSSSLMFNSRDDDLLLSLPIKKRTILFIRVFKFYVFELLFNSLFLLPIMIAYIRWANINSTYFLTSFIMLLMLPIIPIVLSCFVGLITSSLASRFKYRNAVQIIISMIFILLIFSLSFNSNKVMEYLVKHATSLNDLIMKIYYPAGMYAKLITEFNIVDLLIFILVNIVIFVLAIFILSKFYFKINTRLMGVVHNKKVSVDKLTIKKGNKMLMLIKKELNTFFKTPVFIVNSGFALVLFLLAVMIMVFKFDSVLPILTSSEGGFNLTKNEIINNLSLIIFILISFTSYMTSITNSVISLEGRNINILKSLPIKEKMILMSKIYASLVITTPVLLIGDIILFIKFKISIIDSLLLIILSILIPLVSHFIGIIVNLKFPKLDAENSTEVVKQSVSSFLSVMIGMILLIVSMFIIMDIFGTIRATTILGIATGIYIIINSLLYLYLITKGVKEYNSLSI